MTAVHVYCRVCRYTRLVPAETEPHRPVCRCEALPDDHPVAKRGPEHVVRSVDDLPDGCFRPFEGAVDHALERARFHLRTQTPRGAPYNGCLHAGVSFTTAFVDELERTLGFQTHRELRDRRESIDHSEQRTLAGWSQ